MYFILRYFLFTILLLNFANISLSAKIKVPDPYEIANKSEKFVADIKKSLRDNNDDYVEVPRRSSSTISNPYLVHSKEDNKEVNNTLHRRMYKPPDDTDDNYTELEAMPHLRVKKRFKQIENKKKHRGKPKRGSRLKKIKPVRSKSKKDTNAIIKKEASAEYPSTNELNKEVQEPMMDGDPDTSGFPGAQMKPSNKGKIDNIMDPNYEPEGQIYQINPSAQGAQIAQTYQSHVYQNEQNGQKDQNGQNVQNDQNQNYQSNIQMAPIPQMAQSYGAPGDQMRNVQQNQYRPVDREFRGQRYRQEEEEPDAQDVISGLLNSLRSPGLKAQHESKQVLRNLLMENQIHAIDELDIIKGLGTNIETKRQKNKLCDRSIMMPEGPMYNSKGKIFVKAYRGDEDYHTKRPKMVLPRCCNCCRKSVLGCS